MNILKKVHIYLEGLSNFWFAVVITLFTYLALIPFIPIYFLYEKYIGEMGGISNSCEESIFFLVILASIIAPLLETLIFQYGIIKILNRVNIIKDKKIFIGIISASVFGLAHTYSLLYVFHTFIIGLLLSYSFIVYENKGKSGFWMTAMIHCLRNSISTIFILTC